MLNYIQLGCVRLERVLPDSQLLKLVLCQLRRVKRLHAHEVGRRFDFDNALSLSLRAHQLLLLLSSFFDRADWPIYSRVCLGFDSVALGL